MKKMVLFAFLILSLSSEVWAQDSKERVSKEALSAQFKSFIEENQKLRIEHEKELYDLHKNFVEENYKLKTELLAKISALEDKLAFGQKEKNKELRHEIRKTFKDFREKMRERRKDFFKETMKDKRQAFHQKMKARHSELKAELKNEIGPMERERKGKEHKGKKKSRRERKEPQRD